MTKKTVAIVAAILLVVALVFVLASCVDSKTVKPAKGKVTVSENDHKAKKCTLATKHRPYCKK